MDVANANYFDKLFLRLREQGTSPAIAVERVATAYVDGKPRTVGKKKPPQRERDSLFWSSCGISSDGDQSISWIGTT